MAIGSMHAAPSGHDGGRPAEAILEAVGYSAASFLRHDTWEDCLHDVLEHLGRATGASRAYVFRNLQGPGGELLMDQLREWCAPGIAGTMDDPTNHGWPYLPDYAHWAHELRAGRAIHGPVTSFGGQERLDLEDEGILSTVFLPIFAGDEWWGYVGFDDCTAPREWTQAEIDALRAAADIMGGAIRARRGREELAETHRRFQGFMENVPAMLYIDPVSYDQPAIFVSPRCREILGIEPEVYTNDPFWWERHLHPDDRDRAWADYEELLRTGGPVTSDYRIVRPDGSTVWIHDRASVLQGPDGSPSILQGVMFDNSDRARAQEALEQALHREQEAARRLRELDELKTSFLHAVSHDLRTPLTAILGLSLTLERSDLDLPPDEIADLSERIGANARKLDRLLADLLDLDRMDRGILEPRRAGTDVGALVRGVVHDADVGREVTVRAEPLVAEIDGSKVERIVENLLHNAVKYTPPGARIWVTVEPTSQGDVLLVVEDDGPGVPPEDRERIFEPFQRGEEPRHAPGTGIGLSLVARFAELHGGRAWFEEREGGGSSFRVLLPAG